MGVLIGDLNIVFGLIVIMNTKSCKNCSGCGYHPSYVLGCTIWHPQGCLKVWEDYGLDDIGIDLDEETL